MMMDWNTLLLMEKNTNVSINVLSSLLPQANNPHRIVEFINQSNQQSDYDAFLKSWELTKRQLMYYRTLLSF